MGLIRFRAKPNLNVARVIVLPWRHRDMLATSKNSLSRMGRLGRARGAPRSERSAEGAASVAAPRRPVGG